MQDGRVTRGILWVLGVAAMSGCTEPSYAAPKLPKPKVDLRESAEKQGPRKAVFAGGCFWCIEAAFEQLDGVTAVVSGYAGDSKATAKYKLVSSGATQHAEAVEVTYLPSKLSYGQLLQVFFSVHNPTTLDRQGPDHGHQYRSAIFYSSLEEKNAAAGYIAQLGSAKVFKQPIVTTLEALEGFYAAEDYHQNFVERNPEHGYVRAWAIPKIKKLRKSFPELVKPAG